MEPRLAALLGLEAAPLGEREEFEAACRTLFERISERGTVGPRLRGAPVVRPGPPRLHRDDHRPFAGAAILVVTLSRPDLLERRPTWGAGLRSFSNLLLDPLAPDEVEMLLVGLAPGLPLRPSRRSWSAPKGSPSMRSRWSGCSWTRVSCESGRAATTSMASWVRWPSRERWPGCWVAARRVHGARADAHRARGGARPFVHRDALAAATGHSPEHLRPPSTHWSARRSSTSRRSALARSGVSTASSRG